MQEQDIIVVSVVSKSAGVSKLRAQHKLMAPLQRTG